MNDPIERLELFHGHLSELVLRVGRMLRDKTGRALLLTDDQRTEMVAVLETLRDELMHHFADEEEGLFPFVRRIVPEHATAVDALETSHDTICGSAVRLVQAASQGTRGQPLAVFERFEKAYAEHSRDEASLLDQLNRTLQEDDRKELAQHLRGISPR